MNNIDQLNIKYEQFLKELLEIKKECHNIELLRELEIIERLIMTYDKLTTKQIDNLYNKLSDIEQRIFLLSIRKQ